MANRLDSASRGILDFKPAINYTQPLVRKAPITAVLAPVEIQPLEQKAALASLAEVVDVLARAAQARIDVEAENVVIKLDAKHDIVAIQAMQRQFPNDPSDQISYKQYRLIQDRIRNIGIAGAEKLRVPVLSEKEKSYDSIGDIESEAARSGLHRPDIQPEFQIIEPIDIEEININLIAILVNYIWKNFILKIAFKDVPKFIKKKLPEKLIKVETDFDIPGLPLLGQELPDILTGKTVKDLIATVKEKSIT